VMKSNKKPKDMGEVIFSPTIMKIQEDSSNYFIKNIWNLRFEINTYLHKYLFKNLSKGIYSRGSWFCRSLEAIKINNEYSQLLNFNSTYTSKQKHERYYYLNLLRIITNGTIATGILLYLNFYFYGNDNQNICWERFSESECNVYVYDTFRLLSRPCEWKLQGLRSKPNCVLSNPNITLNSIILLALLALTIMSFFKICLNYVYDYHLFIQDRIELSNKTKVLPDTVEVSDEVHSFQHLDSSFTVILNHVESPEQRHFYDRLRLKPNDSSPTL